VGHYAFLPLFEAIEKRHHTLAEATDGHPFPVADLVAFARIDYAASSGGLQHGRDIQ